MTSQSVHKLPAEINSGTRSLHTHLNALITSRLPLALPPHADTPLVYATGLIPFARIYLAFEQAWDDLCNGHISPRQSFNEDDLWVDVPLNMSQSQSTHQDGEVAVSPDEPKASPTSPALVLSVLKSLRPHGLARSDRLRRDIATLVGINANEVDSYLASIESDATQAFIDHINQTVAEKPHLLIAYAFTLYLAIFSGGRWIRSLLAAPGRSFWSPDSKLSSDMEASIGHFESSVHEKLRSFTAQQQECFEELGLAFWFFPSLNDGMDIKAEFKRRLEGAELLLTTQMKAEIVDEARDIFIRCEKLVGELDEFVGRQGKIINGGSLNGSTNRAGPSGTQKAESKNWLGRTLQAGQNFGKQYEVPSYAALALVVSSISWYAMYHAGAFSAL